MTLTRIAVLIPCHNEEAAIGEVVSGLRAALPEAVVYVYDNNSSDRTRERAAAAGAVVRTEPLQGKGNVVRRMFADVEADIYVLVDGDGTYDPIAAPAMLRRLWEERLDMVTGVRVTEAQAAYRLGHRLGNRVLTGVVRQVFGNRVTDMLSGYRCFSRRFVKSFPALAQGFETETEFTVHALELRMPVGEIRTAYSERPAGSVSKLRTYRDGFKILRMILALVQRERPRLFFGLLALFLALLSVALFLPVLETYLVSGLVPRLPTFLASTMFMLLAFLCLTCGLVLDTVTRGRIEAKRIAYLAQPAPGGPEALETAWSSPAPGAKR
ncbi:glycosyltransferase [Roseomonas sp. SSH11]|uniref:Glycosyltransferase n=1 Tax=Pararoseomonas baculiformis TaxID=2820812 RepID=A0ABS4AA28_9PROT|nr:glycosyltransferase [Pararoseomonas baculiformis]MBP0443849.1 glycosyltransferase [Pararoseomonas baculiformis]